MTDANGAPEPTGAAVDHAYLVRLQERLLRLVGSLQHALDDNNTNAARARVAVDARERIEANEAALVEAARSVLDGLADHDPTANSAPVANAVFSQVLTSLNGWAPETAEQCLALIDSNRERIKAIEAEAARSARISHEATAAATAARIRRDAILRALAVGADPRLDVRHYCEILREVITPGAAPVTEDRAGDPTGDGAPSA